MRDFKRIDPILKKLRRLWLRHPDLRLGQLIRFVSMSDDCYYVEDDFIEARLDEMLEKHL